jgi:hypothetical protein
VNGLYYQLDELRELYGVESIEEIVGGIINRKRRLNRPVELQSKTIVTAEEHEESDGTAAVSAVRLQPGEGERAKVRN